MDQATLLDALVAALDPVRTRDATRYLLDASNTPGFTIALFDIISNTNIDPAARLQAATFVKNHIRRNWVRRAGGRRAQCF
jgi:hypothetical protein